MNISDADLLLKISHAVSLQELVNLGCELLGNPIFIDDMHRNILAYSQNVTVDDPMWQENIVENIHDESNHSRIASKRMYKESLSTHRPILLTDLPTVNRYAMTLTQFGVPIGNVTLASHLRPFADGDAVLFELFCHYATELLTNSQYSIRRSQPIAVNTLIRLLDGHQMSKTAVESKLSFMKSDTEKNNHLFLLVISDETGDALSCASLPIIESLSQIPNTVAFTYQHYILALISNRQMPDDKQNSSLLTVLVKYHLFAGISNSIRDVMKLRLYYNQAVSALKLHTLTDQQHLYPYNDIAIFDMLNTLSQQYDLMEYCEEQILHLYEYDKFHEGNLLKTLQIYLESCLQYETTARQLFVHKNTVRYRISKCQQLLNTDFTDGDKIFQYILSLKILQYYHYF